MSEVSEKTIILSHESQQEIDKWLAKYPENRRRSAVIPALHIVQKQCGGWLPKQAIDAVADYIGIERIAVYEVATFYSMYEMKEVGKHKLAVCTNISCMLAGSDEIVAHMENRLGIKLGETTADGKFTLKEVECLGACRCAPVLHYNNKYYERLTPETIDELLESLE